MTAEPVNPARVPEERHERLWAKQGQSRARVGRMDVSLSWERQAERERPLYRNLLRELAIQRKKPRLGASAFIVNPRVAFVR